MRRERVIEISIRVTETRMIAWRGIAGGTDVVYDSR